MQTCQVSATATLARTAILRKERALGQERVAAWTRLGLSLSLHLLLRRLFETSYSMDAEPQLTTEPQLTAGICSRLNDLSNIDEDILNSKPTIQFLSFKKVPPTTGVAANVDRYRIIISDGEHFLQAMLATQLNHLIEKEEIKKHSIVVIEKFSCNLVQDKRYGSLYVFRS